MTTSSPNPSPSPQGAHLAQGEEALVDATALSQPQPGRARAGGALRAYEVYQVELAPYYATTRRSSAPFRGRRQAACPLLSGSIEKNCEDGVRSAA